MKGKKDKDWGREKRKALHVTKIANTRHRGQDNDVITGYNTGFFKFYIPQGEVNKNHPGEAGSEINKISNKES